MPNQLLTGANTIPWKRRATLANGAGTIGHPKAKSEPQGKPHALHEGNSQWIMDVNVKCKLTLLGKNGRKS